MRPLTDEMPKPLLMAGGKPLVVWQLEALIRAGFREIAINTSVHRAHWVRTIGDGSGYGASITWLHEGDEPLGTLGGILNALQAFAADEEPTPIVTTSGDVFTDFDYGELYPHLAAIEQGETDAHFVLADNPPFHTMGDFGIANGRATMAPPCFNYSGIVCWSRHMFRDIPPDASALFPWASRFVEAGRVTATHHRGCWENVGTPQQLADLNRRLTA